MKISRSIILCFMLLSISCKKYIDKEEIIILNKSASTLYVYWSYTDSITMDRSLNLFISKKKEKEPFIIHNRVKDSIILVPNYRLEPYIGGEIITKGNELFFRNSPDKKIRFFYISEQTMRTKTWKEIVKYQLYLKKETYKAEDLRPFYWSIEYTDD